MLAALVTRHGAQRVRDYDGFLDELRGATAVCHQ